MVGIVVGVWSVWWSGVVGVVVGVWSVLGSVCCRRGGRYGGRCGGRCVFGMMVGVW